MKKYLCLLFLVPQLLFAQFEAELMTPDKAIIISEKVLGLNSNQELLISYDDQTIKIWEVESGKLLHSLNFHTGSILGAQLTKDESTLISYGQDGTIKIWEVESGKLLHSLNFHTGSILGAQLTKDESILISYGQDGTIKIWEVESGDLIHSLEGHAESIEGIQLTEDESRLISYSSDVIIKIWDVSSGSLLHSLEGHTDGIEGIQLTKDGSRLISYSCYDKTIEIWDIESGDLIDSLECHYRIKGVQLTKDESRVIPITWSWDGEIMIWDVESGDLIDSLGRHDHIVEDMMFTKDESTLISYSADGTIKIWDIESSKLLHSLVGHANIFKEKNDFLRHSLKITKVQLIKDESKLISYCQDGTIKIWNLESGKLLHSFHSEKMYGWNNHAQLTKDESKLISYCDDNTIKIWEVESGELIHSLEGHNSYSYHTQLTKDESTLISYSHDGTIKIWELESGELIHSLEDHTESIEGIQLTKDASILISYGQDGTIKIWEVESGELIHSLEGHTESIEGIQLTEDESRLISYSEDGTIKIWDIESGDLIDSLECHYRIKGVQLTKDESRVIPITWSWDGEIMIWDVESGDLIDSLGRHDHIVEDMMFTKDESTLISYSADGTIKIWDIESSKLLHSLVGHANIFKEKNDFLRHSLKITKVQLIKDESKLISYCQDGTIKIWNLESGKLLHSFHSEKMYGWNNHAQLTKDESKLISYCDDNTIKIWEVESGELIHSLEGHIESIDGIQLIKDASTLISYSHDGTIKIWDVESGDLIHSLEGHIFSYNNNFLNSIKIQLTKDESRIVSYGDDGTIKIWDVLSGVLLHFLEGHADRIKGVQLTKDDSRLISNDNGTIKIWDIESGDLLYTRVQLHGEDYLVYDKYYRYDGTSEAMKHLYFVCGLEIIELEQVKGQLYVPKLVEMIMNGDTLAGIKKLSDLDICGVVPLIEKEDLKKGEGLKYKITSRSGGLGDVEVYIDGTEYDIGTLKRYFKEYYFTISEEELKESTKKGKENEVKIVALTKAKNGESPIKSRGLVFNFQDERKAEDPSFYALFIGVQDYKDDELDLQFTSKDATDLSKVVEQSAIELFGEERVHVSILISGVVNRDPSKYNIEKELHRIGNLTKPEDVVLVFFAGHGVMDEKTKNKFEFLCSGSTSEVYEGISTEQLMEWMSPTGVNNMKAQKRVLVFDACNSGKINEEILAYARDGEDIRKTSERMKQLEELKDKSGLFILSASASNQSAFELEQLSQGLLTYCLLKTLKQGDVTDEERFLNVSKWFNETEDLLSEIITKYGVEQNAQPFGSGNIVVGELTEEIINSINLAKEKPLIHKIAFQHNDLSYDNLNFTNILIENFQDLKSRGVETDVVFNLKSNFGYHLVGSYLTDGKIIDCKLNILKGMQLIKTFNIKGNVESLDDLSNNIIEEVSNYISEYADKKD